MKFRVIIFFLSVLCLWTAGAVFSQIPTKVESFPVSAVRLTESPFKHAEDMDITYLLSLDADRLLAPYLKSAGLPPKAENYPNWENTGLDGHIGGHYLSALSYMYAATGNQNIKERLDYTLKELKHAQDASGNGYLGGIPNGVKMWNEIQEGKINASAFGLNGAWVPLYNIHKIFAGLRDAYLQAGREDAKIMLVKLTDWMYTTVSKLSDEQIQEMLKSEHGGLNEVFADVAAITRNKKYLELAHRFSHQTILQPLIEHKDVLTGMHANTQIPKIIGFKRIADLEGNYTWSNAAQFFWDTVVKNRSVSIGGNSVREHFHPSDDFSSILESEQGPETCNTYNMLRLTKMLFQCSGDSKLIDYYERALYNHILSTQDPVQGGFVYFTPMRQGHYRVYSQPQTSFWCCVGSGLENHARYGEMIYGFTKNDLYINLFIPSVLQWKSRGISVEQINDFSKSESAEIVIRCSKPTSFTMRIRYPEWVYNNELKLNINGEITPVTTEEGYVVLNRTWKKGDKIHLDLPMHLKAETTPDKKSVYSFSYGPYVLAAKTGTQDQQGLFADDSRGGHIASGKKYPQSGMPVLIGNAGAITNHLKKEHDKPITFTLNGIYPAEFEGLELVPFHRLYECRYAIYFPLKSEDLLKEEQEKAIQDEKAKADLESGTIDKIYCGEQQPESDHFVQMEESNAGSDNDLHWREAKGWFSYQLKNNLKNASKLRITYKAYKDRMLTVFLNGQTAGTIRATDKSGLSVLVLELPARTSTNALIEVKFVAEKGHITPRIYEVRLMQ